MFVKRYIALADLAQADCFGVFNYLIASVARLSQVETFRMPSNRVAKENEGTERGRTVTHVYPS